MNDMRKWDELFGDHRPVPPVDRGQAPGPVRPWLVEQVLDTDLDYVSVLVDSIEVARGTSHEMMIVERAIRETLAHVDRVIGREAS